MPPTHSSKQATVFFDFDGTLADTKQIVLGEMNKIATCYHFPLVNDIPEMRRRVIMYFYRIRFGIFGMRSHLRDDILNSIEKNVATIALQNGLAACIARLHQSGVQLGIITTNRKETVETFLKIHSLYQYFNPDLIVSDINKRCALVNLGRQKNLPAESVFYIGDQTSDMTSTSGLAHRIAVTWGYESRESLMRSGADFIISRPDKIAAIVDEKSQQPLSEPACRCKG